MKQKRSRVAVVVVGSVVVLGAIGFGLWTILSPRSSEATEPIVDFRLALYQFTPPVIAGQSAVIVSSDGRCEYYFTLTRVTPLYSESGDLSTLARLWSAISPLRRKYPRPTQVYQATFYISQGAVQKLREELNECELFSLRDSYTGHGVRDGVSGFLALRADGRTKRVEMSNKFPRQVRRIWRYVFESILVRHVGAIASAKESDIDIVHMYAMASSMARRSPRNTPTNSARAAGKDSAPDEGSGEADHKNSAPNEATGDD